jgi:ubiquinone/menaquinone biosynthesis C-methylase UbiE
MKIDIILIAYVRRLAFLIGGIAFKLIDNVTDENERSKMVHSSNKKLEKVYAASTDEERRTAYNEWAGAYDKDVSSFGIQLPYVGACVFARFVEMGTGPILDAGCGTGMHSLPLNMMGYSGFHGIDISDGMLAIAKQRGIYETLQNMALGGALDLETDAFEVTYSIGCLAPGNAPPNSLDEFIRVTKPGGLVIWSTHAHLNERTQPFHDARQKLTDTGKWSLEYATEPFMSMPDGDPEIMHAVYVYKVL